MTSTVTSPTTPGRLWRLYALLVLLVHAVAAAGGWWLMPGGFPVLHGRFLANRAAPLLVILVSLLAVLALRSRKPARATATLAGLGATWLGAALLTLALFTQSGLRPCLLFLGACACTWPLPNFLPGKPSFTWRSRAAVVPAGLLLGAAVSWTQQAPPPSTTPLNPQLNRPTSAPSHHEAFTANAISLGESVRVQPANGTLSVRRGPYRLEISPMLTFVSRSPDRFWTLFAKRSDRTGPPRTLLGTWLDTTQLIASYSADGLCSLNVVADPLAPQADITALTTLPSPVYSHLNTFCQLELTGHKQLHLAFSPCPDVRIEAKPFDYPVGAPARFAYLDPTGTFHVVEARSGEKGPFRSLARGPLARAQPLTITLWDGDSRLGNIVLHDWAAQLSTDLSPTAGWTVPQNAIEFFAPRGGPPIASIYITLAATSVGRGWDTVGHSPGTYSNHMTVELTTR